MRGGDRDKLSWRPPSFVIAQDAIVLDVVEQPRRMREQVPHRDRPTGRDEAGKPAFDRVVEP